MFASFQTAAPPSKSQQDEDSELWHSVSYNRQPTATQRGRGRENGSSQVRPDLRMTSEWCISSVQFRLTEQANDGKKITSETRTDMIRLEARKRFQNPNFHSKIDFEQNLAEKIKNS